MRTSEAIGIIRGATSSSAVGLANAPEVLAIELLYNRENDFKIQILAKQQPVRVGARVDVLTGFNSSGTDLLSIGTGAGTNIMNAQTVAAAGTFLGNSILIEKDVVDVLIKFTASVKDMTAGRAMIYVEVLPFIPIQPNEA
jgi:hypothetical protein